jgi:hypothetical protein
VGGTRKAGGGSGASGFGAARIVAVFVLALQLTACGGGGGGGGGGDDGGSEAGDLQVREAVTFLSRDAGAPANADPRTSHRMRFRLRGLSNPEARLTDENIEVRRDGRLDVEARIALADDGSEKQDVTLVLDVSGSLTPDDLEDVKASAQDFVTKVLRVADHLRIFEFASPSETRLVGEYDATGNPASGFAWTPSPNAAIQAIDGGSDSTALFHAVRTAILADAERDDILVVFSDGRENSSPAGAREDVIDLLEDESSKIEVFTVGFGAVDADDLRLLAGDSGRFFGVRPSLVGLFDEVGRDVLSVYTLVYDTPSAFGSRVLDVSIEAEDRRFHFQTSFLAGADLARAAIGRFPTLPGSRVVLRDLRTDPPTTLSLQVGAVEDAGRRADGLLAFAVEPAADCTSADCARRFQGVVGAGAESELGAVYVPATLTEGVTTWTDPLSDETFTFLGFEDEVFFRGSDEQRRYTCAVVAFPNGRHCFVPEIGLARTENADGDVVVELAEPPCLASGFSGGCATE